MKDCNEQQEQVSLWVQLDWNLRVFDLDPREQTVQDAYYKEMCL